MKWLPRGLITGPHLVLVLSERAFHRAMGHMKVPMEQRGSWVCTPQTDATTHMLEHPECGLQWSERSEAILSGETPK